MRKSSDIVAALLETDPKEFLARQPHEGYVLVYNRDNPAGPPLYYTARPEALDQNVKDWTAWSPDLKKACFFYTQDDARKKMALYELPYTDEGSYAVVRIKTSNPPGRYESEDPKAMLKRHFNVDINGLRLLLTQTFYNETQRIRVFVMQHGFSRLRSELHVLVTSKEQFSNDSLSKLKQMTWEWAERAGLHPQDWVYLVSPSEYGVHKAHVMLLFDVAFEDVKIRNSWA